MEKRKLIILGLMAVFTLVLGDEPRKGKCAENMHYKRCGSGCLKTCEDITVPQSPPKACNLPRLSGCFCDQGYIFENMTSRHCIPLSDCKAPCQDNAHYTTCGTACPFTCENYNTTIPCPLICVSGCACNPGFVFENETSKHCIPVGDCKNMCHDNAQYMECGTACPTTCENYDKPIVCTKQCVPGCFCEEGFVLENANSKHCIPLSECKRPCQDNAHYTNCGTACPLTCENYNTSLACTYQCVSGCFCKEGFVLENANSKHCVPLSECKRPCQDNAHYTTCGPACLFTCENYNTPVACTDQCVPGCFCEEGFVLESANSKHCVPLSECKRSCQDNAHYTTCGTACPFTCENYNTPVACTDQCVSGCFCEEGFVLESANSKHCIPLSECKSKCQDKAHYTTCGTACPLTCENYNTSLACTLQCVPGCFCEEGFVLESANSKHCVPLSECKKTCQDNALYVECGTACPTTCDNYDKPRICTLQCVPGCFCEEGFVLENATSKHCVPLSECKHPCQDNAHYTPCGTACPPTCENYNTSLACTYECVPGCFCEEGFVLESANSKHCVPLSECKKTCQDNALYVECGTACPATCDNYDKPRMCTLQCVPGCFCEEGFVLEKATSKHCVPLSECKRPCQDNAHYTTCGTACPPTCENYNTTVPCPMICLPGCACNPGFVFENATSKHCVPLSDCEKACQANAVYTECGAGCPLTCEIYDNPPACSKLCVSGCSCEEGFVLEDVNSKQCVPLSDCENPCPDNAP